jgi:hypothetical protein
MSGVIERVIENWLNSSNERSYQIPFCQLLAAEGETVVYVSPHGPFEQGKDVVTIDDGGKVRAYQLKCGDIGLAEWRRNKGEINDLVEMPINHPGVLSSRHHTPYLVTNGEIKDTAIKAINSSNQSWRKRRFPALRTVSRGQLLKRFLAVHGSYLPKELADFTLFMELVLRDGREPLHKDQFSRLLESILPLENVKKPGHTELKRAIASAVLVAGYVLQRAYSAENHWTVFEGWTMTASYILAAATKYELPTAFWSASFDLCEGGATEALSGLFSECETREYLIEGDGFTDGHFYHARVTLLVGLISAWDLRRRINHPSAPRKNGVRDFLRKWLPKSKAWGESATPFFVMGALDLESFGEQAVAESFVTSLLGFLLDASGKRDGSRGLPSPYYSPENALRILYGLDQDCREDFIGESYTAYPLMDFLVRRLRRQALRALWYPITGNSLKAFYPGQHWEWFRWRAKSGSLNSRFVGSPQSWAGLIREVEEVDIVVLPKYLRERPAFAVFFVLVYPHRFTREILTLIETSLAAS